MATRAFGVGFKEIACGMDLGVRSNTCIITMLWLSIVGASLLAGILCGPTWGRAVRRHVQEALDPNAQQWVEEPMSGQKGSIDGDWSERWNVHGGDWNYGKGPTQIKVVGDRVYLYVNSSNGKFRLELKRDKDRLVGTYQGIDNPNDTGTCVLVVVNHERIDGSWDDMGRWDFRRKLK